MPLSLLIEKTQIHSEIHKRLFHKIETMRIVEGNLNYNLASIES